jgi:hypothetical protein
MTLDIDLDISYVKIYRDMSVVIQLQARAARSAQSLSGRADAEARPHPAVRQALRLERRDLTDLPHRQGRRLNLASHQRLRGQERRRGSQSLRRP